MADLDDFFAKRDKKKKTKKFLSTEELVKQLEKEKELIKANPEKVEEETSQARSQETTKLEVIWSKQITAIAAYL